MGTIVLFTVFWAIAEPWPDLGAVWDGGSVREEVVEAPSGIGVCRGGGCFQFLEGERRKLEGKSNVVEGKEEESGNGVQVSKNGGSRVKVFRFGGRIRRVFRGLFCRGC